MSKVKGAEEGLGRGTEQQSGAERQVQMPFWRSRMTMSLAGVLCANLGRVRPEAKGQEETGGEGVGKQC